MAESISEGTLKTWNKRNVFWNEWAHRNCIEYVEVGIDSNTVCNLKCTSEVGDFIHADEEIATIETDKVRIIENSTSLRDSSG